jgi:hypothetical protein
MAVLPVTLLDREIEIAPSLTTDEIDEALTPASIPGRVFISSSGQLAIWDNSILSCGGPPNQIGTEANGAGGMIIGGPIFVECGGPGTNWYQIQFDSGLVGWVAQGSLIFQ